jgi:hypothetical protein
MQSAIRLFALAVAITGLAFASFAPVHAQNHFGHVSIMAGSSVNLPGPIPCQDEVCFTPNR